METCIDEVYFIYGNMSDRNTEKAAMCTHSKWLYFVSLWNTLELSLECANRLRCLVRAIRQSAAFLCNKHSHCRAGTQSDNDVFCFRPKMPADLYYVPGSAPCRSVLLAARAVGLELNLKHTDLMKGEHLTPEFLKVREVENVWSVFVGTFIMRESGSRDQRARILRMNLQVVLS